MTWWVLLIALVAYAAGCGVAFMYGVAWGTRSLVRRLALWARAEATAINAPLPGETKAQYTPRRDFDAWTLAGAEVFKRAKETQDDSE